MKKSEEIADGIHKKVAGFYGKSSFDDISLISGQFALQYSRSSKFKNISVYVPKRIGVNYVFRSHFRVGFYNDNDHLVGKFDSPKNFEVISDFKKVNESTDILFMSVGYTL